MIHDDALRQQLWELVYDLLPEDEAQALCERITSDPKVARAYAEVRLQADLVASAARLEESRIPLRADLDLTPAATKERPTPARAIAGRSWVNWSLAAAALLLICLASYGSWRLASPADTTVLAQAHPRLVLAGPATPHPDQWNVFTLAASTPTGEPLATTFSCEVLTSDGQVRLAERGETDPQGTAVLALPGEAFQEAVKLVVRTAEPTRTAAVDVQLTPLRSSSSRVDRFAKALQAAQRDATNTEFFARPPMPTGATPPVSRTLGVADQVIQLSLAEQPGGRESSYNFGRGLDREANPNRRANLAFGGAQMKAAAEDAMSAPAGPMEDQAGMVGGMGAGMGGASPSELVQFYPEGGQLAVGLPNQCYLYLPGNESLNESAAGRIVDSQGEVVARIDSLRFGRSRFRITPKSDRRYWLELDDLPGRSFTLPDPVEDLPATLATGPAVFRAEEPVEITIHTRAMQRPLMLAAYANTRLIGQRHLLPAETPAGRGLTEQRVTLPLAHDASGILELHLYDYSQTPPQLLARRLAFRLPTDSLEMQVAASPAAENAERVRLNCVTPSAANDPPVTVFGLRWFAGPEPDVVASAVQLVTQRLQQTENAPDLIGPTTLLAQSQPDLLDLILGTSVSLTPVAAPVGAGEALVANVPVPPVVEDNLPEVQQHLRANAEALDAQYEADLHRWGRRLGLVSLVLLILIPLVALFRLASGWQFWVPSLATALGCLTLAVVWLTSEVDEQTVRTSLAFRSYQPVREVAVQTDERISVGREPSSREAEFATDSNTSEEQQLEQLERLSDAPEPQGVELISPTDEPQSDFRQRAVRPVEAMRTVPLEGARRTAVPGEFPNAAAARSAAPSGAGRESQEGVKLESLYEAQQRNDAPSESLPATEAYLLTRPSGEATFELLLPRGVEHVTLLLDAYSDRGEAHLVRTLKRTTDGSWQVE